MFPNGFPAEVAEQLKRIIKKRSKFAFVASEFEKAHEKTDRYYSFFLDMFTNNGIVFDHTCVVDLRMTEEQMHSRDLVQIIMKADEEIELTFENLLTIQHA